MFSFVLQLSSVCLYVLCNWLVIFYGTYLQIASYQIKVHLKPCDILLHCIVELIETLRNEEASDTSCHSWASVTVNYFWALQSKKSYCELPVWCILSKGKLCLLHAIFIFIGWLSSKSCLHPRRYHAHLHNEYAIMYPPWNYWTAANSCMHTVNLLRNYVHSKFGSLCVLLSLWLDNESHS